MIKKLLLIALTILSVTVLRRLIMIFLNSLPVNEEEVKSFTKKIRKMSTEEIMQEVVKHLK